MKKMCLHLQRYALENPGEVKKMMLTFLFFFGCSFIIFASVSASLISRIFGVFAALMACLLFLASCIAIYTLMLTVPKLKKHIVPFLLRKISLKDGGKILDLGSYKGILPLMLVKKWPCVTVTMLFQLDKKKKGALRSIKRKIRRKKLQKNIEAKLCDLTSLPYPDNYFDLVSSSLFFHTLSTETESLLVEEILRVLKPNASLILFDVITAQTKYLNQEMDKALKPESGFSSDTLSFEFYLKYSRKEKILLDAKTSLDFPCSRFLWGKNTVLKKEPLDGQEVGGRVKKNAFKEV